MAEGAKVGDVYVEGRLEYNASNTPAFVAAMQRDLKRRLPDITNNIKSHFNSEFEATGGSSADRFSTSFRKSLDRLNLKLPNLDLPVDDALADIRRVEDQLRALNDRTVTTQVRIDSAKAYAELEALRQRIHASDETVKVHLETDTDPLQNKIKSALAAAFAPNPAVTENLFEFFRVGMTRSLLSVFSSPVMMAAGVALVAVLGQALVAGTIFLGAALTGALIGGLGLGAIAAAIALVADDPKVKDAAQRLKTNFLDSFKGAAEGFSTEIVKALERFNQAIDRIEPHVTTIFQAVKPHIEGLADAMATLVETVAPAIAGLFERIGPILDTIKVGIVKIGEAMADAFKILSDPKVIEGARLALNDLFSILAGLIRLGAEFFAALSRAWVDIRPKLVEMKDALNEIGINGKLVKDVLGLIGDIIMVNLVGSIQTVTVLAKGLAAAWDGIKVAGEAVWRWLADTAWPAIEGVLNNLRAKWDSTFAFVRQVVTDFKNDVINVWNDIKGAWEAGANAAKAILDGVKQAWNDLKNDIRTQVDAIKGFFMELGSDAGGGASAGTSAIKAAWADLTEDIRNRVEQIKGFLNGLRDGFQTVFDGVKRILDDIRFFVEGWIGVVWFNFRNVISEVWNNVLGHIRGVWDAIRSTVLDPIGQKISEIAGKWEEFRQRTVDAWNQIRESISSAWHQIQDETLGAISRLIDDLSGKWQSLRDKVNEVWNGIKDTIRNVWNDIKPGVFDDIARRVEDLKGTFQGFKDHITNIWNAFRDDPKRIWEELKRIVFDEINSRLDDLKNRFQGFRDKVNEVFNGIRDTIRNIWNEIRDQIFNPMGDFIAGTLVGKYTEFKDKVIRIFSEVRDTLGRIWNEMLGAAKGAVNSLAGFVNSVIDAINKIPFVKDKLPKLPGFATGGEVKKAVGGAVDGGKPGTDTVPAMARWGQRYLLDNGEHILTKKDVSAMGGQRKVYAFRNALHSRGWQSSWSRRQGRLRQYRDGPGLSRVRMATGGRVGPDNNGLLEAHKDHVHVAMNVPPMGFPLIIAKAITSGIKHTVGSTFRPGSRGSGGGLDHHSEGRAVDFPGFNQDAFASWWEGQAGVIELIHRTNARDYAIFGGKGGGGLVSFLMTAAGKVIKAAFDKAMGALRGAIGGDLLKGDTVAPTVIRGLFDTVAGQLESFFDSNTAGGGAPASPAELKKWIEEAQKYVNIEWVEGLITLIMRESGGNPRAQNNADSNAQRGDPSRGLMQTIGATFSAYRDKRLPNDIFDPVANIVAGMNYIHARYGSIRNVQQAHSEMPPKGYEGGGAISKVFDTGGWLPTGRTMVENLSGSPEPVLTGAQWDLLRDSQSGNFVIENHLYIDGEPIRALSRQEVMVRESEIRRDELIGKRP